MSDKAIKSRKPSKRAKGIDHGVDFQIGNERKGHEIAMVGGDIEAVSYTHLTLPTILRV